MGTLSTDLLASCNPSPLNMALALLTSQEHDANLLNNIAILISLVLPTHMPFFQFPFVIWHIHHRFYKEMMSSKCNVVSSHSIHQLCGRIAHTRRLHFWGQVPLGSLLKNENKGSEMVDILTYLHQYVPAREYKKEVCIPSINEAVVEYKAEIRQILFGDIRSCSKCTREQAIAFLQYCDPYLK